MAFSIRELIRLLNGQIIMQGDEAGAKTDLTRANSDSELREELSISSELALKKERNSAPDGLELQLNLLALS